MDEKPQSYGLKRLASSTFLPFLFRHVLLVLTIMAFALHGLQVWRIPYLDRLDGWIYDAKLLASAPNSKSPQVVIVDIDEQSLVAFGRWPWARDIVAALVRQLSTQQQAAAIGLDLVFSEPETPLTDQSLALALQSQPVVLGYYFTAERAGYNSGVLPPPVFNKTASLARDTPTPLWTGYRSNLIELTEAAPQAGFINTLSDEDGVIRSAPLIAQFQGQYYESFALGLYRRYLAGNDALPFVSPEFATPAKQQQHFSGIRLDSPSQPTTLLAQISVGQGASQFIAYRGPSGPKGGSFQYISAADVLLGKLPPGSLKDKVVLVGSSAPALTDLRVTPFDRANPSVEVQANLVAGLIENQSLVRPDNSSQLEVFQLLALGLVLLVVLPLLPAMWAVFFVLALAALVWLINHQFFAQSALVLPSAASFGLLFTAFTLHVSQGFFLEGQRRKHLTHLFGNYVSPKWVSRMAQSGGDYSMQASNKVLTVMFCDMRGFTHFSQTMSPLALQALLNTVFDRLSAVILDHGGTIDKYMGDCVMAFWGAPEPQNDHATRALRCALALQAATYELNQSRSPGSPEIKMGIGIDTGLMCVGDMGSSVRRSYTVIGEAVNLAARLETLCKTYNQPLIFSAATKEAATASGAKPMPWQDLGQATIQGSQQSIHIFTLPISNQT